MLFHANTITIPGKNPSMLLKVNFLVLFLSYILGGYDDNMTWTCFWHVYDIHPPTQYNKSSLIDQLFLAHLIIHSCGQTKQTTLEYNIKQTIRI